MADSAEQAAYPPLTRDFYDREVVEVARDLLGKVLVRATPEWFAAGAIVEVEAYLSENDPANHAFRGRTHRNAAMFGPPGHAYIYAIHSRWCLNAVTQPEGVASAVLIRAVEPRAGIGLMQRRRQTHDTRDLARGPARLCEALAIDRGLNGWDLTVGQQLWIADAVDTCETSARTLRIGRSKRVGVTAAHDLPLRFFIEGSPFVSKPGLR